MEKYIVPSLFCMPTDGPINAPVFVVLFPKLKTDSWFHVLPSSNDQICMSNPCLDEEGLFNVSKCRRIAVEPFLNETWTGLGFDIAAGQFKHGTVPFLTTINGPQVFPPSSLRLTTRSCCFPLSPQSVIRFSAKAKIVLWDVRIEVGIRKHFELLSPW